MYVKYKISFNIQNISQRPLPFVYHSLFTDLKKSFRSLKIKAFDVKNKNLEIRPSTIGKSAREDVKEMNELKIEHFKAMDLIKRLS